MFDSCWGNKPYEHAAVVWLKPEQLHELDWAEADLPVLAVNYCQQPGKVEI
jgi:hypothetical protein